MNLADFSVLFSYSVPLIKRATRPLSPNCLAHFQTVPAEHLLSFQHATLYGNSIGTYSVNDEYLFFSYQRWWSGLKQKGHDSWASFWQTRPICASGCCAEASCRMGPLPSLRLCDVTVCSYGCIWKYLKFSMLRRQCGMDGRYGKPPPPLVCPALPDWHGSAAATHGR